jgi:hypothetical protein
VRTLFNLIEDVDLAPTPQAAAAVSEVVKDSRVLQDTCQTIKTQDIEALNVELRAAGLPVIDVSNYSGAQLSHEVSDPNNAEFGDELFSIDLLNCQPLSKRFGWGLGYDNVEVKGKEEDRCVIRKVTAWEGDYTISECRPKTSLERLVIIKGPLFNIGFKPLIEGSLCKVVKSGHQFPGDPEPE